ncbi:MAG TPA: phosphonate ABC transporter, permease protein PhnE [Tissierellaceae bacterium]|nr:phosphonate ABC transporter, permease protein PhnE [Tissierellaceae bacterium]
MSIFDKIFPPKNIDLPNGKVSVKPRSKTPIIVLIVLVFTYISFKVTEFDLSVLFRRGKEFFVILGELSPPNWDYLSYIWTPLFDTIKMSLFGSTLGALVSIPIAILASNNIISNKFITSVTKLFLSVLRTLPTLVTALIATYIFGLGTMAGTVAIFLFSLSYVGKLLYEQIETVDMGGFEAMESMGFTKFYAFKYAIFPVVLPSYLSTALFNFEGNVRYAAILGYVGAGGIGLILNEKLGWRDYPSVGMILLSLLVTVFIIESISEHFRKKLD